LIRTESVYTSIYAACPAMSPLAPLVFALTQTASSNGADSVYRLNPTADGLAIGISTLLTVTPYALASHWITPRCPCDPSEINSLDRGAVGNHSRAADVASDTTVALAILVPLAADALDQSFRRPFWEDGAVLLQTVMVNNAITTIAK